MQAILDSAKEKMEKSVANLDHALTQVRTGRASAALVNEIEVEYYGSPTPINQIAQVSVVEGRTLVIKPFDRSCLKDMEAALNKANLGIAPQNDGTVVRLTFPALTEDRRKELTKDVAKYGEEAKVAIRNVRRDGNDAIKKNKELTEDQQKEGQEEIQKLTDAYIKKIDTICEEKNKEIMSI